ncbi:nuclear transport factor 2 family protein [Streptomyces sp. NBC_01166]|uniref:nuclear transport factor 2 family protein n=1 Tax=Streptomyces sp. NBC_01166 TaxID=2903755 RepID=UPI00386F228C|nr:nuclear transport factor 2 family protein [Streptomyces sp. NBC_01166]
MTALAEHPNARILRVVYADLAKIADYADQDIMVHLADRTPLEPRLCRGAAAVLAHEQALIRMTHGTLVMDVHQIAADDHFGAVLGVLRATRPRPVAVPFCGLWRFIDGRVVEHWENAADPALLSGIFAPRPDPAPR